MPTRTSDVPLLGIRLDLSLTAAIERNEAKRGIHSRVLRAVARAEQIVLQEGNPQEARRWRGCSQQSVF